jgi:hypothetical protein
VPAPILRARPPAAKALAASPRVALLVGSYDGSGNYGDLAQLDGAFGLLRDRAPDLLPLPVVEQQFAATHELIGKELVSSPEHVLYFDGGGDPGGEGLVTLEPPSRLELAAIYLYGGGFLNPDWGSRKLAMLEACETIAAHAGRIVRLASGQQVDPGWLHATDGAGRRLRQFQLLGGRDADSAETLAGLGAGGAALRSGDDAVGVLAGLEPAPAPGPEPSPLEVNVHFAEHEWVTGRPDRALEFDVAFLTELGRLAGRPLRVRPLLAYLDPRIDERSGLDRFGAACAARGIESAEPRVLRASDLDGIARDMGGAALTVSSSYHVALTSLLMAIPTVILHDNGYYAQKSRGLLSDFDLPPGFAPSSDEDPEQAAKLISAHILDPEQAAETRAGLEDAARQVRQRRIAVEERVISLIARGPSHEIADVRRQGGELSFEARLEGVEPKRIWLRSELGVEPSADAVLPVALMPAMRSGGTLTMSEPVSPRLLRMQSEFQAIQRAWSREWAFEDPPLRQVEVKAPRRQVELRAPTGRVAAFFSGGVDSFHTVLTEEGVTDLIFVRGLDILERFDHQKGLAERVEARLGEAAAELGLPLHLVETNLRDLSEATGAATPLARWEGYYNSALAAVALFLEPFFDRVLISTEFAYDDQLKIGSSWMVDQLWGSENMEIADVGGLESRVGRIGRIASNPVVQKTLRVCWQNPDGAYNCGRCRKCLLTMATLESLGQLRSFETFPHEIDLERLAGVLEELRIPVHLAFCEEALDAIRGSGHPQLERTLAELVANGRKKLGLDEDAIGYAERRAAAAEEKLDQVLASRSWRITAPLRRLIGARRS